jgi:hypothetical protein
MTPGYSKRFAASGRTAVLALAGILLLGSGLAARAQSDIVAPHKGLAGTWRVQLAVRDCQTDQVLRTFPALLAFGSGGTLTVATAGQPAALSATGLGVWHRVEGHTYRAVSESFVFDAAGAWIQTHRLIRAIKLDGDKFTDTVTLKIFDASGNLIVTGCATSLGTRMK